jgi:hypothetical protein
MVPAVLRALTFRSNNDEHRPLIRALNLLKQYADGDRASVYYASTDDVPIESVVRSVWRARDAQYWAGGQDQQNGRNSDQRRRLDRGYPCTEMEVEKEYVDSHGQSEIAFAFTHLLGFELMPRLKRIHKQILWRPEPGANDAYAQLQPVLSSRAIQWDLIAQQYDEMVKYATAMRLGTADAEAILRRFSRSDVQHPTYAALAELGKVRKTIFLCNYLHSEELRREVHEALNVIENWVRPVPSKQAAA